MTDDKSKDLQKEIAELKNEVRQIKEVLNIIIGMMQEDEGDDEDVAPPFLLKHDIDMNMLN
ncbi:MAG TPA: hypothetical protein ENN76_02430 [Euryarchaeota archaeon]|nr:hypothetical protein [Euryarchaeota archaeon]